METKMMPREHWARPPLEGWMLSAYRIVPGLLGPSQRAALHAYAIEATTLRAVDPEVPRTPVAYGDPIMEALLEELRPRFEREVGLQLFPTYSYLRVYKSGDSLRRHRDREACEISVSLSLGYLPEAPWPLWLEHDGAAVPVVLQPGDALVYRGIQVPHWRETYPGQRAVQVFLHYVAQDGPYRAWKYDQRAALGLPSVG